MTDFRIVIEAERNIAGVHDWIALRSLEGANRWHRALADAIARLQADPERFPVAPESHRFRSVVRDSTIRPISGRTYRVLFTVMDDVVHVLYVRGPGQDWIAPGSS